MNKKFLPHEIEINKLKDDKYHLINNANANDNNLYVNLVIQLLGQYDVMKNKYDKLVKNYTELSNRLISVLEENSVTKRKRQ